MKIKSGFSKSSVWWLPVYETTDICQYWLKLVIKEQSHKYNCCLPELHMWWLQAAEQRDCLDRWFLLGWTACTTHQGGWHWRGNWSPPQSQDAAGQSSLHVGQKKKQFWSEFYLKKSKSSCTKSLTTLCIAQYCKCSLFDSCSLLKILLYNVTIVCACIKKAVGVNIY